MSAEGFSLLAQAIKKSAGLEEVGLIAQQIDAKRAHLVADVISSNPNLRVVRLDRNLLDDNATAILAHSLVKSNVETLILDDNKISDSGAKALAVVIANGRLKSISLANNKIKVLGASAIATALKHDHSHVTEVSLSGNGIPRAGGEELKEALELVKRLVKFDMRGNWFSAPTLKKIKQIMKLRRKNKKDVSDLIKR